MNKEKIIERASGILGVSEKDERLSEFLGNVLNENYGWDLTDEQWAYGLVEYYAFVTGRFEVWSTYATKFNEARFGVAK